MKKKPRQPPSGKMQRNRVSRFDVLSAKSNNKASLRQKLVFIHREQAKIRPNLPDKKVKK